MTSWKKGPCPDCRMKKPNKQTGEEKIWEFESYRNNVETCKEEDYIRLM